MGGAIRDDLARQLEPLGLQLHEAPAPRGRYSSVTVHDGIAYVSGQVSRLKDDVIAGPVDEHTPSDVLKLAAEACVLRALGALATIDDVYEFDRVLFLRGYVNAVPDFTAHSAVLDEASTLLQSIFGDRGSHSRSAIGVSSLPSLGLLEIEMVVSLIARPDHNSEHSKGDFS